jgi:hypothetical protein
MISPFPSNQNTQQDFASDNLLAIAITLGRDFGQAENDY